MKAMMRGLGIGPNTFNGMIQKMTLTQVHHYSNERSRFVPEHNFLLERFTIFVRRSQTKKYSYFRDVVLAITLLPSH